jgi:hypothetical protein
MHLHRGRYRWDTVERIGRVLTQRCCRCGMSRLRVS